MGLRETATWFGRFFGTVEKKQIRPLDVRLVQDRAVLIEIKVGADERKVWESEIRRLQKRVEQLEESSMSKQRIVDIDMELAKAGCRDFDVGRMLANQAMSGESPVTIAEAVDGLKSTKAWMFRYDGNQH